MKTIRSCESAGFTRYHYPTGQSGPPVYYRLAYRGNYANQVAGLILMQIDPIAGKWALFAATRGQDGTNHIPVCVRPSMSKALESATKFEKHLTLLSQQFEQKGRCPGA